MTLTRTIFVWVVAIFVLAPFGEADVYSNAPHAVNTQDFSKSHKAHLEDMTFEPMQDTVPGLSSRLAGPQLVKPWNGFWILGAMLMVLALAGFVSALIGRKHGFGKADPHFMDPNVRAQRPGDPKLSLVTRDGEPRLMGDEKKGARPFDGGGSFGEW